MPPEIQVVSSVTWADWVQMSGLLVGFMLAAWQLSKIKSATAAATQAVQRTERRLSYTHALVLVPQMTAMESALDAAVAGKQAVDVAEALVAWRGLAGELRGVLSNHRERHRDLIGQLQRSAALAAQTKATVLVPNSNVGKETEAIRQSVSKVCGALSVLLGELKTQAEETSDDGTS